MGHGDGATPSGYGVHADGQGRAGPGDGTTLLYGRADSISLHGDQGGINAVAGTSDSETLPCR